MMKKNRDAFTLIELLIVVAIIGILAAIAVPNFMNARIRANVARSKADLRTIGTAMQMYKLDHKTVFHWLDGFPDRELAPLRDSGYLNSIPDDSFANKTLAPDWPTLHYDYHSYGPSTSTTYHYDWALWGNGPDQHRQLNCFYYTPETRDEFLKELYEPSNGVRSGGDMVNNSWYGLTS
ncbi:MAG: prepilin-type N-terminal cleavage/methylation domain-containing protein [bacterium]